MNEDTDKIIRAYLVTQAGLTGLIGGATPRIHCPRLPENTALPALSFLTRGGDSDPYIPGIVSPSVQFDCWAKDIEVGGVVIVKGSIKARQIYSALYDCLQGIQDINVVVGVNTYKILSAEEEVQGQDLVNEEIQNYFRVLTFFKIMIRAS